MPATRLRERCGLRRQEVKTRDNGVVAHRPQNELPPANRSKWDLAVLHVLQERDGIVTIVQLKDSTRLRVFDIAWGYDAADTHSHITSNISPGVKGASIDFFRTDDVVLLVDPETNATLLDAATLGLNG